MKRVLTIEKEQVQIGTIQDLTSVFEGIASLRIAKIKNKVVASKQFFQDLWQIYSQLRVAPGQRITSGKKAPDSAKNAFIVITSEGGLSGDIDEKIVKTVLGQYDPTNTDIIVIGAHGATLLSQRKVEVTRTFKLPDTDKPLNVTPIITTLSDYKQTSVFYETYVSLAVQQVVRIELISVVKALSEGLEAGEEVISPEDYLFEPSLDEVIDYMESVMLGVALSQILLDSKLAQYASRFKAMSAAEKRAKELALSLFLEYHRAKRNQSDERLKEITTSLKMVEKYT